MRRKERGEAEFGSGERRAAGQIVALHRLGAQRIGLRAELPQIGPLLQVSRCLPNENRLRSGAVAESRKELRAISSRAISDMTGRA